MPCSIVVGCQYFGGPCYLHLQSEEQRQKGSLKCWHPTATLYRVITKKNTTCMRMDRHYLLIMYSLRHWMPQTHKNVTPLHSGATTNLNHNLLNEWKPHLLLLDELHHLFNHVPNAIINFMELAFIHECRSCHNEILIIECNLIHILKLEININLLK